MAARMRFDVKCVREHLRANGMVYTVRGWFMKDGVVDVDGLEYRRVRVMEVTKREDLLEEFVENSGFKCKKDWWSKIEGFCRGRRKWLYLVTATSSITIQAN